MKRKGKIEVTKARGYVTFQLFGPDGSLKNERTITNLVVDDGLEFITSRMIGTATAVMSHMAVGTDNTAAAAGQTALVSELARIALDSSTQTTTTGNNDTVQYVATFTAGTGTGTLQEAAILNAASNGVMLCRTVISPAIVKGASDSLVVTWKHILSPP